MLNVVPIHSAAKAHGTAIATALMAKRYGQNPDAARAAADTARELVERGHSPARARATMLARIRRDSPGTAA